jgi:hypothetical protein
MWPDARLIEVQNAKARHDEMAGRDRRNNNPEEQSLE